MIHQQLSDDARLIRALANQTALEMNNEFVTPLHVAVAMLRRMEGNAGRVLQNLGVDPAKLLHDLRIQLRSGGFSFAGKLPTAPATDSVLMVAVQEAKRLGHALAGSEHVLLALSVGAGNPVAEVYARYGLMPDLLREEIRRIHPPDPAPTQVVAMDLEKRQQVEHAALERQRVRILGEQLSAWRHANEVRAFVGAVRAQAAERGDLTANGSELSSWLEWASGYADRQDPIRALLRS